jgi:hypothetical protein
MLSIYALLLGRSTKFSAHIQKAKIIIIICTLAYKFLNTRRGNKGFSTVCYQTFPKFRLLNFL